MSDKNEPRLEVFYDGACVVCAREMEHYYKQEGSKRIRWVNISHPDFRAEAEGLDPKAIHFRMHGRRGSRLYVGVETFLEIWSELPRYKWVVPIVKFPLILFFAKIGYTAFALIRPYLPKQDCSSGTCEL